MAEKFQLNQTQTTLLNLTLNVGMDKGIDFAGKQMGLGRDASFAENMSYEDAKAYNLYWDNLEKGVHNNHPGISDMDMAGWELADNRLSEHMAVDRIDTNAVMELRLKELELEDAVTKESGKYSILSYEDAENIAFDAIHGPNNADAVVLGKYGDGGPTAYTSVAKDMDAQYFQLDNWDELAARYSDDEIWKINEKFLDIQTSSGREIYLSHNPEDYLGKGQFYSRELQYLLDNGYKFVDEGRIWHAVR